MLIRSEDMAEIVDWSAQKFASWLSIGLTDKMDVKRPSRAFAPLHKLFIPTMSKQEQLGEVYHLLPSTAKASFAEGIGLAASDAPTSAAGVRLLEDLAHLSGYIGSASSIGRLIDRLNDPAFLASIDAERARETFALLLNIAAGLSPAVVAQEAVKRLITSPRFEADYSFMAFDALIRAEPARIMEHLDRLDRVLKIPDISGDDLDYIVGSITAHTDTKSLEPQLEGLTKRAPRLVEKLLDKYIINTPSDEKPDMVTISPIARRQSWTDLAVESYGLARAVWSRVTSNMLPTNWPMPRLPRRAAANASVVGDVPDDVKNLLHDVTARQQAAVANYADT